MTSILKTDEIQSQNGGAVVKMQTLKHPSASGNNLELGSDGTTTVSGALTASGGIANAGTISAGTISDAVTQPDKYYIQGNLNADHTASGAINFNVAGTTNPYFAWEDTLSNRGFDVGSSSNYDFKFTKKGIYQINFSASFHHVTSNTTRLVTCAIRGDGSTSVSTNVLAMATDQIAQTLTNATDYGGCSCNYVGLFDVNDLINFWTEASTPASDAVRREDTHVSVCLIRAVA